MRFEPLNTLLSVSTHMQLARAISHTNPIPRSLESGIKTTDDGLCRPRVLVIIYLTGMGKYREFCIMNLGEVGTHLSNVVEAVTCVVSIVCRVNEIFFSVWPVMEYSMIFTHYPVQTMKLVDPCGVESEFLIHQN
jgi:hypothetical protein